MKLNGDYIITDKGELSDGTNTYPIQVSGTTPKGGNLSYENNVLKNGCITIDEYKATIENGEVTTVEKGSCASSEVLEEKIIKIISQKEAGKLLSGDELAIDTEHFYVVSSDENETVMLAKYNLLVGDVYNNSSTAVTKTYIETDNGFGLQNELSKGYTSAGVERIGVIAFNLSSYWNGQVGENLKYPGNYGGPNYPYVYDINSVLYNYIELYKTHLEGFEVVINDARLLSYQEAKQLGCGSSCPTGTAENSFITGTSFWTGSASGDSTIWVINTLGHFRADGHTSSGIVYGVRPVVVVSTSDIL